MQCLRDYRRWNEEWRPSIYSRIYSLMIQEDYMSKAWCQLINRTITSGYIRHFIRISHNAPYLPSPPPPQFCITFVFLFLLRITAVPREIEPWFSHTFSVIILQYQNYRKCMEKLRFSKNWSRMSLHSKFSALFLWTRKLLTLKRKHQIYEFRKN